MPYTPPSLSNLRDQISASIESRTGQDAPTYEKAFYSVLSNAIALVSYPIYKFISWNYRQNFVVTADEDHLESYHGADEGVQREYATKTEFDVALTVSSPVTIPVSTTFENEATGLFYFPKDGKDVTVSDNTITLIADGYGAEYAVDVGDELVISGSQISEVSSLCTVDSISIYGMDEQDLEDYRKDVLQSRSGVIGGSTVSDYRKWGQAVSGVYRVFPFSGRPYYPSSSLPGDRTVFVEADHELGTDGIPISALLATVKSEIETDPDTGLDRECLGLTGSTLFVEAVQHVYFHVYIYNLVADSSIEDELKSSISTSVTEYLKELAPYVSGLDPEYERNDNVSNMTLSNHVKKILDQYSSYAYKIEVSEIGVGSVTNRILIGGDLARLYMVTYVD
jgi:uncharacterized phage protein gp47/JayE